MESLKGSKPDVRHDGEIKKPCDPIRAARQPWGVLGRIYGAMKLAPSLRGVGRGSQMADRTLSSAGEPAAPSIPGFTTLSAAEAAPTTLPPQVPGSRQSLPSADLLLFRVQECCGLGTRLWY